MYDPNIINTIMSPDEFLMKNKKQAAAKKTKKQPKQLLKPNEIASKQVIIKYLITN